MAITIDATYENGMLKPAGPLPHKEKEKVRVSIYASTEIPKALEAVERTYGLLQWTGDSETVRQIAEDDEFGIMESP